MIIMIFGMAVNNQQTWIIIIKECFTFGKNDIQCELKQLTINQINDVVPQQTAIFNNSPKHKLSSPCMLIISAPPDFLNTFRQRKSSLTAGFLFHRCCSMLPDCTSSLAPWTLATVSDKYPFTEQLMFNTHAHTHTRTHTHTHTHTQTHRGTLKHYLSQTLINLFTFIIFQNINKSECKWIPTSSQNYLLLSHTHSQVFVKDVNSQI